MNPYNLRLVALLAISLTAADVANSAKRASFVLDNSISAATHIVLATEGDKIDGRLKVIESWQGRLEPGAEIVLPDLAKFASEESRTVNWWGATDLPEHFVRVVSGNDMLLFLVEPSEVQDPEGASWLPATEYQSTDFGVSVAWIDNGEAYAIQQIINPGPAVHNHLGSALEIRAKLASFKTIQMAVEHAMRAHSPVQTVQAVRAFDREGHRAAIRTTLDALAKTGKPALPTLRLFLNDSTIPCSSGDLIRALVIAGGKGAAPDLTAVINEERDFWEANAPKLYPGWWNDDPATGRTAWLRKKYNRLLEALRAIAPLEYEPCRQSIEQTRDLWTRIPALNEVGNGQIGRACEVVLYGIPNVAENP